MDKKDDLLEINLLDKRILSSKEASVMWGKNDAYVRTVYSKYPKKFPKGTLRKFGKQLVVTEQGMRAVTGREPIMSLRQARKLLKQQ